MGKSKYATTLKNTQRYYTTKRLIRCIDFTPIVVDEWWNTCTFKKEFFLLVRNVRALIKAIVKNFWHLTRAVPPPSSTGQYYNMLEGSLWWASIQSGGEQYSFGFLRKKPGLSANSDSRIRKELTLQLTCSSISVIFVQYTCRRWKWFLLSTILISFLGAWTYSLCWVHWTCVICTRHRWRVGASESDI